MKLIDRIGLAANSMDSRILALLKDVNVIDFMEIGIDDADLSKTLVVGQDLSLPVIFKFVEEQGLSFMVQETHEYFFYNLLMTAMICRHPDIFLKSPIAIITRTNATDDSTITVPFDSTKDKQRLMHECERFVTKNSKNTSILQNLKIIISEMFSNAMYSAPTDDGGNYPFASVPRNTDVTYPRGKVGEIVLSYNNEIFAVTCSDPFGSVNKLRVKKRLAQVFDPSKLANVEYRNNQNVGSGLGLRMIIENSLGFGMVVKEGKRSLVYATLPTGLGNRKVSRYSKNICFKFYS